MFGDLMGNMEERQKELKNIQKRKRTSKWKKGTEIIQAPFFPPPPSFLFTFKYMKTGTHSHFPPQKKKALLNTPCAFTQATTETPFPPLLPKKSRIVSARVISLPF